MISSNCSVSRRARRRSPSERACRCIAIAVFITFSNWARTETIVDSASSGSSSNSSTTVTCMCWRRRCSACVTRRRRSIATAKPSATRPAATRVASSPRTWLPLGIPAQRRGADQALFPRLTAWPGSPNHDVRQVLGLVLNAMPGVARIGRDDRSRGHRARRS